MNGRKNGRVAAQTYCASFDNPPFDRSPLDGYALKSTQTPGSSAKNARAIFLRAKFKAARLFPCPSNSSTTKIFASRASKAPGQKLSAGKIYNSNLCLLAARLIELGFAPKILGNLPDNADICADKLSELRGEVDLLIRRRFGRQA